MTNAVKKGLYSAGLFLLYAIAMEMFLFIWFDWGAMPEYFLLDFGIMLFIALVVFIVPKQWLRIVIMSVFLGLQLVLSYANICVMHNISSAFIFDMFTLAKETAEVVNANVFVFEPLAFYLPIIATYVASLVAISKLKSCKRENEEFSQKVKIYTLVIALLSSFSFYSFELGHIQGTANASEGRITDSELFSTFYVGSTSIAKFGTYGFYFEDLFRRMFGTNKDVVTQLEAQSQLISKEYEVKDQILFNKLAGDNLVVIMAESFEWYAISPEMTPVLFSLANGVDFSKLDIAGGEYFYSYTPNPDGTFSTSRTSLNYDDLNCDEVGLTLLNYHSKAKTDYSEHSVIIGGYPFKDTYTNIPNLYEGTDYCYTLPSQLKAQGYETGYFHTWLKDFYNRVTLNKRFGFDKLLFIDDMDKMENYHGDVLRLGAKDSAFMQLYYDDFTHKNHDGPFMSFFTSVSTHGSYEYNPYLEEMYPFVDASPWLKIPSTAQVDNNLWNDYMRTYYAGAVDMEFMVSYLVYNLALSGELDNTTIVFYADHNNFYYDGDLIYKPYFYSDYYDEQLGHPYYWLEKSGLSKTYDDFDPNRYSVPAFIYSTRLNDAALEGQSHYVKTFTEAYDLTATIMTLFGLNYLPGGYMGYPVYCQDLEGNPISNHVIISQNSGVFSDKIYSDDGIKITYAQPGVTDEEKEEFKNITSQFFEKWRRINAIYKYDLFKEEMKKGNA